MDKNYENQVYEKCKLVFTVFGAELERLDDEIKHTEKQLRKLKRERKKYSEYINLYKDLEGRVFGV